MHIDIFLDEFVSDWRLAGRSLATVANYRFHIRDLVGESDPDAITLAGVKQ